jgi:hypothetical protein
MYNVINYSYLVNKNLCSILYLLYYELFFYCKDILKFFLRCHINFYKSNINSLLRSNIFLEIQWSPRGTDVEVTLYDFWERYVHASDAWHACMYMIEAGQNSFLDAFAICMGGIN